LEETSVVEVPKNKGFFKKGNTYGKGRPKNSKHQIEPIRRRILQVVQRRIFHERDLHTVSTEALLKFLASIMPKEQLQQATQVNYISNVPRDPDPLAIPRETLVAEITPSSPPPVEEKNDPGSS
jgi:hypothetical protein